MKKLLKRIGICLVLAASVWCGSLLADRQRLNDELIRFHVVANSDSEEDQSIKLQVRDAVLNSLQNDLNKIADVNEARAYLQAKLPQIQAVANSVLEATGCDCEAVVTLCKEAFDTRYYDTFTLPAGIYEALRITIGEGEGHNWWCVAFPSLCLSATSEEFADKAGGQAFRTALPARWTGKKNTRCVFSCWTRWENWKNFYMQDESRSVHESKFVVSWTKREGGGQMLHLLLGTDWTANRDEVMKRIAADVAGRRGNRILMVPELISHETERRLCAAAGDTASRYAEVLSFTRLARRVADSMGSAAEECLDNGGRVVAMAAAAKNLSSRLKAYAAVETKPEFLTGLIDAVDEFKRCCISSADLSRAAGETEGSLAQKLEELSLLMESYDALCSRGKRDPRDQMTWLLEQMEQGDFAREHVFYIDGFPDFTRQHLAILEHLIQASPDVTVSLNCDREGSHLLAFEKAGDTASQLFLCARRAGVEVKIETVPGKRLPLSPLREGLFQGAISRGAAKGCLDVVRAESPYLECMGAADRIRQLLAAGCRCRDITVVCTDMTVYQPLVNLVFHRLHIPVYQSGTEDILQKSVIATVLMALDAALSGFDQKSVLRYLRSALSPVDPDTCDRIENYAIIWGIRGQKWTQSWENHPDGLSGVWTEEDQHRLEELNTARELAIAPLTRLWQGFRDASDLRGQILALYGFLEDISLEMRLSRMAQELDAAGDNRAAQILNQLWEILLGALEQMYDMLGDTHWEGEQFIRLFRLLLSQYDVGTIPPVLDAVQVGPVSAMRCHQEKHLIVLGAEEGKLPGYSGSAGVLTDQERVTLRELGVPLTGGAMEGVQAEFAEIYGCFCGAMASVSVFCSGDQPSFVYRRLCELAGGE